MNKGITISIFLFAALTMILLNIRLDMDLKNSPQESIEADYHILLEENDKYYQFLNTQLDFNNYRAGRFELEEEHQKLKITFYPQQIKINGTEEMSLLEQPASYELVQIKEGIYQDPETKEIWEILREV